MPPVFVVLRCFALALLTLLPVLSSAQAVAFYYGENPPWNELQAFDWVVVDPDHVADPKAIDAPHTSLVAYAALGEVQPARAYAKEIPAAWLIGSNQAWGSRIIDQSEAQWPAFFADRVIEPLWQKGYRFFFLDTLDSYQLLAKTDAERARQEDGMVLAIRLIHQRHPDARLILNRGFEILDRVHDVVEAVAAESLFKGYNSTGNSYRDVSLPDRQWLIAKLNHARNDLHLKAIAIDYLPASERAQARKVAEGISQLGFIPWVATPALNTLGVGSIEVMPRRVLVIQESVSNEYELRVQTPVRLASLPLNYLGYVPEFADANHLPDIDLQGRYAGVLVWLFNEPGNTERKQLSGWLQKQMDNQLPISFINIRTSWLETDLLQKMGIKTGDFDNRNTPIRIAQQDAMLAFERQVSPALDDFTPLSLASGKPLLTLEKGASSQVAAAITPWGGFVLGPYAVSVLPGLSDSRWSINPFDFLKASLHLPDMPVPDASSEGARRMLMVHMDGDGFVSRTDQPGNPMSGEVVRNHLVRKYPLPMSISVIEAELSASGLYPALSSYAENVARDIYKLPNVEAASHSYSHPFIWHLASKADSSESSENYNLRLPGYKFDLQREIAGSIDYMQAHLLPPDKKVMVFFWTGDCVPGNDALALTNKLGVQNFNGGDTTITHTNPSITRVEGLGLQRAGGFQVFAPNQNENVYTNLWTGPFYGHERLIETFEMTESPRRLKPMDIYFHTYAVSRRAGLRALEKIFDYAQKQNPSPVFVSEYTKKVLDFQNAAIAKTQAGWRIRSGQALRSLRIPQTMGSPLISESDGIAGFAPGPEGTFIFTSSDTAELHLDTGKNLTTPKMEMHMHSLNGRVLSYTHSEGQQNWQVHVNAPLRFTLANAAGCEVRVDDTTIMPRHVEGKLSDFETPSHAAQAIQTICKR